jgi:CheY-like chemotaxis protein
MKPKKVLVADDETVTLRLHHLIISRAGHETALFPDGDSVLAHAAEIAPDLAILDYGLPGQNGLELTRAFRANPALKDVPIIVVTGYREVELAESLRAAGANEVMLKPFSPTLLAQRMEEFLALPA